MDSLVAFTIGVQVGVVFLFSLSWLANEANMGKRNVETVELIEEGGFKLGIKKRQLVFMQFASLLVYANALYQAPNPKANANPNIVFIWYLITLSSMFGWDSFLEGCDRLQVNLIRWTKRIPGSNNLWFFQLFCAGIALTALFVLYIFSPLLLPSLLMVLKHEFTAIVLSCALVGISLISVYGKKKGAVFIALCSGFYLYTKFGNTSMLADNSFVLGVIAISMASVILIHILSTEGENVYVDSIISLVYEKRDGIRRMEELEQARQLQLSMLPQEKPLTPQIDISWYMETATEVGGDYYDYTLDSDGSLTVVLGDATGHGMQAGTVVTASKTLFQSMGKAPHIIETFSAMSRGLKNMNFPRLGMAMAMIKVEDKTVRFSSAGMPPMLLWRADGKHAEEVLLEGMPLGYTALAEYEEIELKMGAGDTILLMSDGLAERLNNEDELFDYDKTLKAFESVASKSPDDIIQHMVSVGNEWADGRENDDDESFICLKFK
jgi:hypothetical protein